METLLVVLWLILTIVQSAFGYAMYFAHFQRKWPSIAKEGYATDMRVSGLLGGLGSWIPIGGIILPYCLTNNAEHGLKWS